MVKHLIETYRNGNLKQKELLLYYTCIKSQIEQTPTKLKVNELEQFRKIKERVEESLEISFDDEQIERTNTEILNRLFESQRFNTMIKALMHINSILEVIEFKLKVFSKLHNLNYETSEE